MCKSTRRHGYAAGIVVAALACLHVPPGFAETIEERLQRLENEIQELRQLLTERQQHQQVTPTTGADEHPGSAAQAAPVRNGTYIRYYISNNRLGEQPPDDLAPLAQGAFSGTDTLSFDPAVYDIPDTGLLSNYRDPASFRYIGLLVEAELNLRTAGEYEFILSPKPAREGGSSVSTRMSAWLRVGERTVVAFRDLTSWRPQRGRAQLGAGVHRVQLWAVVASDGFGPSPADSHLVLAFKAPGDVSPGPLPGWKK